MTYCPTPQKIAYELKIEANAALLRAWKKYSQGNDDRRERTAYLCDCGRYHLTSQAEEGS